MNPKNDIEVEITIDNMLYAASGAANGMTGSQILRYKFDNGKMYSQELFKVRWQEDKAIEDKKRPYEMPASPARFEVVKNANPNPFYALATTHPEGGICIHAVGRSEGCILIDTATTLGLDIYKDIKRRVYDDGEKVTCEIVRVTDRRRKEDVEKYPVYYANNDNYVREYA